MSENRDFSFCPRCGALMQNGVCQSCGYGKRLGQPTGQTGTQPNAAPVGQPTASPNVQVLRQPKKSNKLVIGLCIGGGVFLLLALVIAMIFMMSSWAKSNGAFHEAEEGYYEEYGDDYEYYEPDEEDPYYKEIVDSTRTDLDYKICWASASVNPDDYEEDWSYYATYPILEAAEGKDGDYAAINAAVQEMALKYKGDFRQYPGGASSYGYVTYMDEDKISVVYMHSLYESYGSIPLLDAITFEVETGRVISTEEVVEIDEELAMRFRAQDKTQNGGIEYVQNLSDEELLEILRSENVVTFYTPVGLEIGFNYDGGWVTVTLKERAL